MDCGLPIQRNWHALYGGAKSYSLLHRHLEREMFGLVNDRGLGTMVYSPLAVGLLSNAYLPVSPPPGRSGQISAAHCTTN